MAEHDEDCLALPHGLSEVDGVAPRARHCQSSERRCGDSLAVDRSHTLGGGRVYLAFASRGSGGDGGHAVTATGRRGRATSPGLLRGDAAEAASRGRLWRRDREKT